MQEIVGQSQSRSFRLACENVEHGFFGFGLDLGQVRHADTRAIVDVGLGSDPGLAPLFLGQVHDLLRGTSAFDGGREHGKDSITSLEGLDKLVRLLNRLSGIVGGDAVLAQGLWQVFDLSPVSLDLNSFKERGGGVKRKTFSFFPLTQKQKRTLHQGISSSQ